MTYNSLRKGRCSLPDHAYLVTTVTANRTCLFTDLWLGREVVLTMRELDTSDACETYAYVVIPDHVHWLFLLGKTMRLSKLVQRFKGISARRVNCLRKEKAPVWQPSFHDHAVRSEESLTELARYTIMNPVRAGLVRNVGDYSLWDAKWLVE